MAISTAPIVAAGLAGGYATARYSGHRDLGGAVLATCGVWCGLEWLRNSGPAVTGVLSVAYMAGFAASHPLAKRIGGWPSVLAVTVPTAAAAYALADRPRRVAGTAR